MGMRMGMGWDGPFIGTIRPKKICKKKKKNEIYKVEDIGVCGFLSLALVADDDGSFCQLFDAIFEVEDFIILHPSSHHSSHIIEEEEEEEEEWGNTYLISELELIKLEEVVGKMELCLRRKIQSNLEEQLPLLLLTCEEKLKPYQLKSVKWLISLWQAGFNGILADPIGIGNEIVTICFLLAHLKVNKDSLEGGGGPYLIITNVCNLIDWVNEIRRSAPSMAVIIYHGDEDSRRKIRNSFVGSSFPVIIITSFWVAFNDMEKYFGYYNWKYVVIDDGGHWMKDKPSNVMAMFNHSRMENKLLLITSTPQPNKLTELWSLLNFLLPAIEESTPWFELLRKCKVEARTIELEERRVQVVAKLYSILRPFLCQRLITEDDELMMMLPHKELVLYAGISDHQKEFQDSFVRKNLQKHLLKKRRSGSKIRSSDIKRFFNSLMTTLRINYNCPTLLQPSTDVFPPMEQLVKECGKLSLLDRLLTRLFIRNHRVIIITETSMVHHMLCYYLHKSKFEFCSIDKRKTLEQFPGGDRIKSQMEKFNDPLSNLRTVIISTQAYEMGINFSEADTIILYGDTESSTQTNLQIIDKYQSIRQAVYIYRLETPQYIQEKDILALLEDEEKDSKKMLHTDMSDEDLERVLDRKDILAAHGRAGRW